jgi:hypothetical protein
MALPEAVEQPIAKAAPKHATAIAEYAPRARRTTASKGNARILLLVARRAVAFTPDWLR